MVLIKEENILSEEDNLEIREIITSVISLCPLRSSLNFILDPIIETLMYT